MILPAPLRPVARRASWDVPVEPDADTARDWLRAELADPAYHQAPSLLQRILAWLLEQLDNVQRTVSAINPWQAAAVVVAIAAVVGVVAFLVAGPVARGRRARRSTDVFGDDARTAAELSAAADAHAAAGRFDEAVLDMFRAVLRSLEERAVIDARPGSTAHEAAEAAGVALPNRLVELRAAGSLFDEVCYGDRHAGRQDDAWLREVASAVAAARPAAPVAVAVAG